MLTKGMTISARLIEEVEKDRWIISYQGHLLAVKNTSPLKFKASKVLQFEVTRSHPLELKIAGLQKSIAKAWSV